jgi:hypothetical protein
LERNLTFFVSFLLPDRSGSVRRFVKPDKTVKFQVLTCYGELPVEWPLGCDDLIISCGYAPLKKSGEKLNAQTEGLFTD